MKTFLASCGCPRTVRACPRPKRRGPLCPRPLVLRYIGYRYLGSLLLESATFSYVLSPRVRDLTSNV